MNGYSMPIYLVISEYDNSNPVFTGYRVEKIVKVYACDFSNYENLWREFLQKMVDQRVYNVRMYSREPPNMFRGFAEEYPAKIEQTEDKVILEGERKDREKGKGSGKG